MFRDEIRSSVVDLAPRVATECWRRRLRQP